MRNNETKRTTIEALDVMIQNVAQGASGFWVEDHEGCGNPKIFPEFEEGLKRGRLVQKSIICVHGILPFCMAKVMVT